jgi:hypothetical protein
MKYYQIFGERNSGTKYLKKVMDANFNLEHTEMFGHKHWFIKDHYPRGYDNKTTDCECLKSLDDPQTQDTLFIFIVREPFSWLQSMWRLPHHAYDHHHLSFSDFIRKPWTSYDPQTPWEHRADSEVPWRVTDGICWIESAPNICQLRNLKNQHFLGLKSRVPHFALIHQERLLEDLQALKEKFNLVGKEDSIILPDYRSPQDVSDITPRDRNFILAELNPDIEYLVGYNLNE